MGSDPCAYRPGRHVAGVDCRAIVLGTPRSRPIVNTWRMADRGTVSIEELVALLVADNAPLTGYSGIFSEFEGGPVIRRQRVWRWRDLSRIEDPPGRLEMVACEDCFWWPSPTGDGFERQTRDRGTDDNLWPGPFRMLDPEEYWSGWLSHDPRLVTSTLRRVVYENRPAWRFTAPWVKGGTPVFTVDAELGLIVRKERADVGVWEEWTKLALDPSLNAAWFDHPDA